MIYLEGLSSWVHKLEVEHKFEEMSILSKLDEFDDRSSSKQSSFLPKKPWRQRGSIRGDVEEWSVDHQSLIYSNISPSPLFSAVLKRRRTAERQNPVPPLTPVLFAPEDSGRKTWVDVESQGEVKENHSEESLRIQTSAKYSTCRPTCSINQQLWEVPLEDNSIFVKVSRATEHAHLELICFDAAQEPIV